MCLLLLITDLERGGTPTVVRELATRLRSERLKIEVACLSPWGPVADELAQRGVKVTALGARSVASYLPVRRRLVRLIQEERFDVVFSFLVHANVMAATAMGKCPNVRLIESIQTTQPRPGWHWTAQRWAARRAEKIVVPSCSIATAAQRRSGISPDRIQIIPNAIDPRDFAPIRQRPARSVRTIGFVGRLDPVKRVEDLIGAMARVDPALRLLIFGDGPERPRLARLIERMRLSDRVQLYGMVSTPQEALRQIDLLVLPSEAEGMPMVLIEAMAAGVPIVATDAPGIRDVITHERNGLLVPVDHPAALAETISRLARDADLHRRLVANGLDEVQHRYTWEAVLPMYETLLLSSLNSES